MITRAKIRSAVRARGERPLAPRSARSCGGIGQSREVPTPVSDTGAMSRSWDELVEQAQRDVHRGDAPVGDRYFEKEAADVLAALRLWIDLSGRGDGDWLREHLTRDSDRLLADARRDLAVSGEEYAAQLLESVQQMREQDRDRVKDVVRIGLSWST